MSAFLMFAQDWRKNVKEENPDMTNADVSRLLGEKWRSMDDEARTPYREREEQERRLYTAKISSFKSDLALTKISLPLPPRVTLSDFQADCSRGDTSNLREENDAIVASKSLCQLQKAFSFAPTDARETNKDEHVNEQNNVTTPNISQQDVTSSYADASANTDYSSKAEMPVYRYDSHAETAKYSDNLRANEDYSPPAEAPADL